MTDIKLDEIRLDTKKLNRDNFIAIKDAMLEAEKNLTELQESVESSSSSTSSSEESVALPESTIVLNLASGLYTVPVDKYAIIKPCGGQLSINGVVAGLRNVAVDTPSLPYIVPTGYYFDGYITGGAATSVLDGAPSNSSAMLLHTRVVAPEGFGITSTGIGSVLRGVLKPMAEYGKMPSEIKLKTDDTVLAVEAATYIVEEYDAL